MKLHDRIEALGLLWLINDIVVMQTTGQARKDIQEHLLGLRRIIENQKRQGTPR